MIRLYTIFLAFILTATAVCQTPTISDNFATGLDTTKWFIQHGEVPNNKAGVNWGMFEPGQVDFTQGMLRLSVEQELQGKKVISHSGEVISTQTYGYGTYTFVMRMGSTAATHDTPGRIVSGSVSSAFLFWGDSITEIDIEYLGSKPNSLFFTTWVDRQHHNTIEAHVGAGVATSMHPYILVWKPGIVQWFLDGKLVATSTKYVPSHPATIRLNHWGTHGNWGGLATPNLNRYMYVKSVTYTPLEKK